MLHPIRAGLRRQPVLHNKLTIIKIREEEVLHLCHAIETAEEHHKGQCDGCFLITNQEGDTATHKTMHGRVHQLSLRVNLLVDDGIFGEHLLRTHRHLHQSQHPAGKQADTDHQEEVARILTCRTRRKIDGQESRRRDDGSS